MTDAKPRLSLASLAEEASKVFNYAWAILLYYFLKLSDYCALEKGETRNTLELASPDWGMYKCAETVPRWSVFGWSSSPFKVCMTDSAEGWFGLARW